MSLGEMLDVEVARTRPQRRFTVDIRIGADSLEELYRALVEIEKEILQGGRQATCAGPDSGWRYYVEEIPDMTHERYFEELSKWHSG